MARSNRSSPCFWAYLLTVKRFPKRCRFTEKSSQVKSSQVRRMSVSPFFFVEGADAPSGENGESGSNYKEHPKIIPHCVTVSGSMQR